jgi:hypothetical protein
MHGPPEGEARSRKVSLDATAGAMAGCLSRFVVGPLDVIKIRFQVQIEPIRAASGAAASTAASKYTGVGQAFFTILKEEGIPVMLTHVNACNAVLQSKTCRTNRACGGELYLVNY